MIDEASRYAMGGTYVTEKSSSEARTIVDHERPIAVTGGSGIISHVIVQGETLEGIAFRYYQDATKWWVIADVNNIQNPLFPPVGVLIDIPIQAST
jgi:nucleoid-associated protein YgaU